MTVQGRNVNKRVGRSQNFYKTFSRSLGIRARVAFVPFFHYVRWTYDMNPGAMADDKEKHYLSQLQAALTAGHWESTSPAKTPNGYPLSWSELFRKFKKHSKQSGMQIREEMKLFN